VKIGSVNAAVSLSWERDGQKGQEEGAKEKRRRRRRRRRRGVGRGRIPAETQATSRNLLSDRPTTGRRKKSPREG